jgi:hypothetical protein
MIATRLERGRWQQLHWGVYAAFTGPPPRTAWLWAAVRKRGGDRARPGPARLDLRRRLRLADPGLRPSADHRGQAGAGAAAAQEIRWRHELEDVLAAAADGIHSALEYRYLRDVERAHGLPRSRHQVRVVIEGKTVYRDAYYEKFKLATELDGKLAHPDQERWRDNHRDNQAGAHGILTTRYGWRDVYGHPCETALLLRKRGWTGKPRPCSPACPVRRA